MQRAAVGFLLVKHAGALGKARQSRLHGGRIGYGRVVEGQSARLSAVAADQQPVIPRKEMLERRKIAPRHHRKSAATGVRQPREPRWQIRRNDDRIGARRDLDQGSVEVEAGRILVAVEGGRGGHCRVRYLHIPMVSWIDPFRKVALTHRENTLSRDQFRDRSPSHQDPK